MKDILADIWDYAKAHNGWVVIPTNGFVRKNGSCVMGRGLALQATKRYPGIAKVIGGFILENNFCTFLIQEYKLVSFPVKYNWWEEASLELIGKSAREFRCLVQMNKDKLFLLPHVGCGNGKLDWKDVKHIIEKNLGDLKNIIIVNK